jgi:hypothetical protein
MPPCDEIHGNLKKYKEISNYGYATICVHETDSGKEAEKWKKVR